MKLFSRTSAYDLVVQSGNTAALEAFEAMLAASDWGLYRVERFYERNIGKSGKPYIRADRRVVCLSKGSRVEMMGKLDVFSTGEEPIERTHAAARVYSHRRMEGIYPAVEGVWVVCPALVADKVRNAKSFAQKWAVYTGKSEQLTIAFR